MAADAPYTGARTRAPRILPSTVPARDNLAEEVVKHGRAMSLDADAIESLIVAVEVMLRDQRATMRENKVPAFLCDNQEWDALISLLALAHDKARAVHQRSDEIELMGGRASKSAAA